MEQGEYPLSDREYARIRARVYAEAGIALSDAKRMLAVSRLAKILRRNKFASFDAYLDFLEQDGTAEDAQIFVNALTTNLTRFWREEHHFVHLATHVAGIIAERKGAPDRRRLRIWSAGCSTGQEPYTIALTLLDRFPELARWDFKILATDIDTAVLSKAMGGIYPGSELHELTPEKARLFERLPDGRVKVPEAAASLVSFKPLNLLVPWPMRGKFEAVFCRNVTIYFDKRTQAELFSRFADILTPGGVLYVGHSENLGSQSHHFQIVGKTAYQVRATHKTKDAA
ncbi:MAG TPA: protein-glutamate O-methyltransferase CheR [Devosia sp.]|nr:protein-glutamate O-methyltransferase CheR [Devosia sp.]